MLMTAKIFFDTNILVYSGDPSDLHKQKIAQQVTEKSFQENSGFVSTQVLQEYCSIEIKKLRRDPLIIKRSLSAWQRLEVINITPMIIDDALEIHLIYQFSFWDSLVISSALAARCGILMTEDMHHGQTIQGLTIVNPFKK